MKLLTVNKYKFYFYNELDSIYDEDKNIILFCSKDFNIVNVCISLFNDKVNIKMFDNSFVKKINTNSYEIGYMDN